MSSAQTVTATFNPPPNQTLTVSKSGTGTGTVTSNPAGINCGLTCSYSFDYGVEVTLTASTTQPITFSGWSGGGCSGTGTCTVILDSDQNITASFSNSPILISPANGVTLANNRPVLDWMDVPGANSYDVQISKSASFKTSLNTYKVYSSIYTASSDLAVKTVFYWRVRSYGSYGVSGYSEIRSFTTGNPPSIPGLVAPKNNALITNYRPLLQWKKISVPKGTIFQKYELQLATDSAFTAPVTVGINGSVFNTQYIPGSDLNPNSTYYWQVRAVDTVGGLENFSAWSKVRFFRTAIAPSVLLLPANGSSAGTLIPVFDWNDPAGATGYKIQISKNARFTPLVGTYNVIGSTFTPVKNLPVGTLWWRVQAKGPNGPSAWSSAWTVTIP